MSDILSRYEWSSISDEEQELINKCYGPEGLYKKLVKSTPRLLSLPDQYLKCREKLKNIKVRPDDLWVISNPKTGTTWTQDVAWLILTDVDVESTFNVFIDDRIPFIDYPFLLNMSDEETDEYMANLEAKTSPRLIKSHLPFELLPDNLLDTCKVIFPSRNIKDTAISYFYHESLFNVHDAQCDAETYVGKIYRNGLCMYGGYWEMLESALKRADHPNMLFFWFEEMKKDHRGTIVKIMNHIGKCLSDEDIDKVNSHMTFDNYKKKATMNKPDQYWKEGKGEFVRKGKVGDWKNHFSRELTVDYDNWIRENLTKLNITDPTVVEYFQIESA